jgi:hypothetical protein
LTSGRHATTSGRPTGWPSPDHSSGPPGTVDPNALADHQVENVYADAFDGLCFVAETTRACSLDDGGDADGEATGTP